MPITYVPNLKVSLLTLSICTILTGHTALAADNVESYSSANSAIINREDPVTDISEADMSDIVSSIGVLDFGETVVKTRRLEDGSGMVFGVAAERTKTGTGTDTEIVDVPQSISVVSSQEMEEIDANDLKEAVRYTPGVAVQEDGDKSSEVVYIRGFKSTGVSLRDGRKQKVNMYDGSTETYGLERVEVLKGPASILYGAGSPGGVINQVSKKAEFDDFGEIKGKLGSFSSKQIAVDVNRELTEDIAVRVIGLYRDADSSVDHVNDDRVYLAGNLQWWATDDTTMSLRSEFQKDKTKFNYGLPPSGSIDSNQWGKLPRDRFNGNPNTDKNDKKSYSIALDFEHAFTNDLTLTQGVSYFNNEADFDYTYAGVFEEDIQNRLYRLAYQTRDDESKSVATNINLVYDWEWSNDSNINIDNTTLVGADYSKLKYTTLRYNSDATVAESDWQYIDLYMPNYSAITAFDLVPSNTSSESETKNLGILLQNQMTINDKWVAVLGGRYDKFDADTDLINLRNFPNLYNRYTVDQSEHEFSARAGLVYKADNGIAPYASYSESFQPVLFPSETGLHDPITGKQYELGVRYTPPNMDALFTASTFIIKEDNSLVPVYGSLFQQQLSETEAKGFELEAKTKLGDYASLILGYAYTDTEIKDAGLVPGYQDGDAKPNVPKQTLSAFINSDLGMFDYPQIQLGVGMRYVGEAETTVSNQDIPDYTVFDARASYEYDDWLFSLSAKNLLDSDYISTCTYACFFGSEREINAEVTYSF